MSKPTTEELDMDREATLAACGITSIKQARALENERQDRKDNQNLDDLARLIAVMSDEIRSRTEIFERDLKGVQLSLEIAEAAYGSKDRRVVAAVVAKWTLDPGSVIQLGADDEDAVPF